MSSTNFSEVFPYDRARRGIVENRKNQAKLTVMTHVQPSSREMVAGWRDIALKWMRRLAESAVALDPKDREAVLAQAREELGPAGASQFLKEQLAAAERAAEGLVTHNEKTQEAIDKIARELAGVFRSVTLLAEADDTGEAESLLALRRILEEPESGAGLQSVKDRLLAATDALQAKVQENRARQKALVGDLQKRVVILEAIIETPVVKLEAVMPAPREVGPEAIDPCTGLPDREAAELAIWKARETESLAGKPYAAAFPVSKIGFYRTKYGAALADMIALAIGQQLGEAIPQQADLYRWSETAFVAILRREGDARNVAKEVAGYVASSAGWYFEERGRNLLLTTKIDGRLFPIEQRAHTEVSADIAAFVAERV